MTGNSACPYSCSQPWASRVVGSQVGFEIKRFVSGEEQWAAMCNGHNGSHPVMPQG